jgi:hypothetical protein
MVVLVLELAEDVEDLHAGIIYAPLVRLAALAAALLALAGTAAAAPPRAGLVVPGQSLGGVALGAPMRTVAARWGRSFGICRGCRANTWYFTYARFKPEGAGVSFRNGRAAAIFTLWSPLGWRTPAGVAIGNDVTRVTTAYGALGRHDCDGYYTLTLTTAAGVTEFYVVGDRLWGFGISLVPQPCR